MAVKKFNKMVNPEKIKGDTRYGDLYKPHRASEANTSE